MPRRALIADLRRQLGAVLVVDDGMPAAEARALDRLAAELDLRVLHLASNAGKGHAIAAGLAELLGLRPAPDAVLVIDADGQHPPGAVPSFLRTAADAELVIGDRFGDLSAMPLRRRLANRVASRLLSLVAGRRVRDSQCGMRLLRGRALHEVPFPTGRYEAETRHLKRCLREGLRVAWVGIPTLYDGQASSFRPVRDSLRVLVALIR